LTKNNLPFFDTVVTRALFIQINKDLLNSEAMDLSRDPYQKQFDHVLALPWQAGLRFFL
jgi:hypothetical protein